MKNTQWNRFSWLSVGLIALLVAPAWAGPKKSRKPPKPLNKEVQYEAYKGTDVAQVVFKTSRQEFRVGHAPYRIDRFHTAEFYLVTKHLARYLRPDFAAEIKMAPGRDKPSLSANKTFQGRWKEMLKKYAALRKKIGKLKRPRVCAASQKAFSAAMQDELALARAVSERTFAGQDIRSRERLAEQLQGKFRNRNTDWFDRLTGNFIEDGNLNKFYPRFTDLFIKPVFDRAAKLAEKAMSKVGVEFAIAVEEKGEITQP